jgi:hypothetical protein
MHAQARSKQEQTNVDVFKFENRKYMKIGSQIENTHIFV